MEISALDEHPKHWRNVSVHQQDEDGLAHIALKNSEEIVSQMTSEAASRTGKGIFCSFTFKVAMCVGSRQKGVPI